MTDFKGAQHTVMVWMVAPDHQPRWTITELQEELSDIEPELVRAAVDRLHNQKAIYKGGDDETWATPAVRYLATLGFIEA